LLELKQLIYIKHNNAQNPNIQNQNIQNQNMTIYNDNQNVHNSEIQCSVSNSLWNLISDSEEDFSLNDIISSSLNMKTKSILMNFCADQTLHSIHLIKYCEILSYVWNRIQKSEHKLELMKILEEQITESMDKCFTGRIGMTLSVLVGFYDDIKINISDKSRISAIILNCKEKIIPYDSRIHQEIAIKELIEVGYSEHEIKEWIEAIAEFEDESSM
jgi:hypothetical protein